MQRRHCLWRRYAQAMLKAKKVWLTSASFCQLHSVGSRLSSYVGVIIRQKLDVLFQGTSHLMWYIEPRHSTYFSSRWLKFIFVFEIPPVELVKACICQLYLSKMHCSQLPHPLIVLLKYYPWKHLFSFAGTKFVSRWCWSKRGGKSTDVARQQKSSMEVNTFSGMVVKCILLV